MPKISAATVAEHREAQTRTLLDAARTLLAKTGARPSLAAVAVEAGLARSSVYQYFASADDLLLALVDDLLPRWEAIIAQHMAKAQSAGERVLAYVYANLRLVSDGEHAVATVLHGVTPEHVIAQKADQVHRRLGEPLITAVEECGVQNPSTVAHVVTGVISAAATLLEQGMSFDEVWDATRLTLGAFSSR